MSGDRGAGIDGLPRKRAKLAVIGALACLACLGTTSCGSTDAPRYLQEIPAGSATWQSIAGRPAFVDNPPPRTGHLRFRVTGRSNLRSIAATGPRPSAERPCRSEVERILTPACGGDDARRAAAAATANLALVDRACKEEIPTRDPVPGNTLCTAWALWEVPFTPILAALPPEDRTAARTALESAAIAPWTEPEPQER